MTAGYLLCLLRGGGEGGLIGVNNWFMRYVTHCPRQRPGE